MKISIVCLLAGLACILLLAAGCTSTPGTPAVTPTATTAAGTTAPTTAAPAVSFAGTWNSTWTEYGEQFPTRLALQQTGSSVTGIYVDSNGTIQGTLDGAMLTGTWSEFYEGEMATGTLEFVMSADQNSFTGKWASTLEELATTNETWNGVRV